MPPLTPGQFASLRSDQRSRLVKYTLGRQQGPQLVYSTTNTFAAPTQITPNGPLPIARPVESLLIVLRGRVVIGTADYTAGVPEAPQTLVDRIVVTGTHKRYGYQTPISLTGATAFTWLRLFQPLGNDLVLGTTRSLDPGMPFVQTTGMTAMAQGTYDFMVCYEIPVAPFMGVGQTAKREQTAFLWRPEDWNNDLSLTLFLGDKTSLGTPAGGTTVTWTAFGSGAGTPSVEVFLNYSLLGDLRYVSGGGLCVRTEQLVAPALTAVATDIQLNTPGLQKAVTTNIVTKTGIVLTGTSGGVNVYASLSDVQLDRTRVLLDNKVIRDFGRNYAAKNYYGRQLSTVQPQGYFLTSFVEGGSVMTALRGDTAGPSANLYQKTDVLTANANNRQGFVQEIVLGGPFA